MSKTSSSPDSMSALALSTTMTSRMFESLQRLPDQTFRRVASTSLTPSLSATLLLVGRGDDEPRVRDSRRAHSTEPSLPSHLQWQSGSESLEKRMARNRGHKLVTLDQENRKMSRRISSPKRVSHWTGGEATDPKAMASWYSHQAKHMRRGCQLPPVLPKIEAKKSEEQLALSALQSDTTAQGVMDVFKHQAWSRVFESDMNSLLNDTNGDYAMERALLTTNVDTSLYNDVRDALPELLVARRRRLTMVYDTWRSNTQMLRKYRRIFMARIIRMNRQRLERSMKSWCEFVAAIKGEVLANAKSTNEGVSAAEIAAQNREAMEAVWAEKAAARAAEKKKLIAERDAKRKEEAARERAQELQNFRVAAAAREAEIEKAREERNTLKREADEKVLARARAEEAKDRARENAAREARDKAAREAREEADKLERASASILDVFGDSRANAAARESLKEPEPEPVLEDAAAKELAEQAAAKTDEEEAAAAAKGSGSDSDESD